MRTLVATLAFTLVAASPALAQGGQAAARTAGQAYQNVTVLKDIPATELIPAMRYISTALGVECEFCHVGARAQETPGKVKARQMMTMMMTINNTHFGGRRELTCFGCHHGSTRPASAPEPTGQYSRMGVAPWFAYDGGPVTGGRDVVMSDAYVAFMAKGGLLAGLPTTDQILEKYIAALGGEQAIRRVSGRIITGSAIVAGDVRGWPPPFNVTLQIASRAPNQWVMTTKTAAGATTANGFDGNVAWLQAANGNVTETTGPNNSPLPPLARVRRNADFYEPLNLKQQYQQLTLQGIERVNDRDAYHLTGTPADDTPEHLYFDVQSGLLARKTVVVRNVLGDYAIQTDYEDYRPTGGVKIPFRVKTVGISPAESMVISVEKVETNPPFEASRFAKPAPRAQGQ
jgi:hypothetical protein